MRRVGLQETEEHRRRDAEARLQITQRRSTGSTSSHDVPDHIADRLRDRYGSRVERLEARVEGEPTSTGGPTSRCGKRWPR